MQHFLGLSPGVLENQITRVCKNHKHTFCRAPPINREWPRYCRKVYWTKMVQNGANDHFGQNDLISNRNVAFASPKWSILVHFGLKRSILVHLGPPTVLWPFLNYPLPRNYYENNSLRIFFVIFEGFCALQVSRKERLFQGNYV